MEDMGDNPFGPHMRTNDPAFSAALNQLARICGEMDAFLHGQRDHAFDLEGRIAPLIEQQANARIWFAELDARGSADGWYTGHEVVFANATGVWVTKTGGREWDATSGDLDELMEIEGCATCLLGSIVAVRRMLDDAGHILWYFEQPADCAATSSSSSSSSSSSGL